MSEPVLAVLKVTLQKANGSGNVVFTLFLLQVPVNVVAKQSGFTNREGKGADDSAGSRSLAMCYWYFFGGMRFCLQVSCPNCWESLEGG